MKKFLKIFLIVTGSLFALIVAAMILIPVLFKDQILTVVKKEINRMLIARVDFSDFRLNLIRSFPNLSMELTDLSVAGTGIFEGDTLVSFRSLGATLNLMPLIKGEGIQLKSVLLDRPVVFARALQTGEVNWDIMAPSEEIAEEVVDTTAMEMPAINVQLKKFEIREGRIGYLDEAMDLLATLEPLDFTMRGDMTKELTTLVMEMLVGALNVEMDGIRYLNNARLKFDGSVAADLKNMEFILEDNEMKLNEIVLGLEGKAGMTETGYPVDLTFFARETSFKSLLSMVPAIYTQDFEGLETTGRLSLTGYARGEYSEADSSMPDIGVELIVMDAMFRYPDLPRSVDKVNIVTNVFVDGKDLDRTRVDVETFSFRIGDNPFAASLRLRTPMSDPDISGKMDGIIDLGSLADVVPMEGTSLKGILNAALTIGGRMSWIEKEDYEKFTADGSLKMQDFEFTSPDIPVPVAMPVAELVFSPRFVEVRQMDLVLGESDLHFTGRMENFIPYVFKENETLRGRFAFTSSNLNLNELIPEMEETPEEETTDSLALSVIEVPGNIDFELASSLDRILYSNMELKNLKGKILVRDRKVMLDQLLMDILKGTVAVTGEYNTQDMENPKVGMNLNVRDISIPMAWETFVAIQKLAPLAKGLSGDVSLGLKFNSLLGQDLMPLLSSVNGSGNLQSSEVALVESATFDKIQNSLKLKDDLTNTFQDLDIKFRIIDGNLLVDPFETKMGSIKMIVGGRQGLDQSMDFLLKMAIPRSSFGQGANQVVENLAANAAQKGLKITPGEMVNVDVQITGTVLDPKISLNMRESMAGAMQEIRQQVQQKVEDVVEEKKEEILEKVEEKVDTLKSEARERAQRIIDQAEQARTEAIARATAERDKAYAGAAKIEQDAKGNMVEQLKAKGQAEGIRKTADAAFNKAKEVADNEYQKAIDRAKAVVGDGV